MQIHVTRSVILGVVALSLAGPAQAQDYGWLGDPVLRGSQAPARPLYQPGTPTYYRWEGLYFGGQLSRSFGAADFSNATASQISYILANTELQNEVSGWTTLPKGSASSTTYGGFIGYNIQWEEAVIGVELNYNRMALNMTAQDSIGPILVAGATQSDGTAVQYRVIVASQAAVAVRDVATARARFAWVANRFLPYAFVGIAVGNTQVSRSASLDISKALTPPPIVDAFGVSTPQPQGPFIPVSLPRNPQSESRNVIAYGYTAGLGIDIAVLPNVFVRGEWEWIDFASLKDVKLQLNTVRAGVGVRF